MGFIWAAFSFVLAAAISGAIAAAWQRRSWAFQQKMLFYKERYDRRIDLTAEVFSLVDGRLVATRNYVSSLVEGDISRINLEREKYRVVVDEWNKLIPSLTISMKSLYGARIAYSFDNYFPGEFASIDGLLRRVRLTIEGGGVGYWPDIREANGARCFLNIHAREFSDEMLSIAEDAKSFIEANPKIDARNMDNLSYSYLLESLFKPRSYV